MAESMPDIRLLHRHRAGKGRQVRSNISVIQSGIGPDGAKWRPSVWAGHLAPASLLQFSSGISKHAVSLVLLLKAA
jgi:hypothetical protein